MKDVMVLTGWRRGLLFGLAVAAIALPQHAGAKDCKRSQDCALEAFQSGEIQPLAKILGAARGVVPGEVVKIELDRKGELWVYEIKILTPSGKRREVKINAQTLAVIKVD